jgi:hypothetical protein
MKKFKLLFFKAGAIILLMLTFLNVKAQVPTWTMELRNDVQTSDRVFTVDVYLLHTGGAPVMELANFQCGISYNSAILNGGVITPTIIAGDLPASMTPSSIQVAISGSNYFIRIAPRTPPGTGNGYIVSAIAPGTKLMSIRLTNSVAFGNASPNFTWLYAAPYPSRLSYYDQTTHLNMNVTLNATMTSVSNLINFELNDPPTAYNVSGTGSYCAGGTGLTVTLSNSQTGVNYQLKKDGLDQGTAVAGTGAALTWDSQLAGTYTVVATNAVTNITNTMTGSAIITEDPSVAASVSIVADLNDVCAGTSVTFTATPTNGGPAPTYQWKVNGGNVGTGLATYSYVPANGDAVTCEMTSTLTCVSGSPATSNIVNMVVNAPVAASVAIVADANPVTAGTTVTFTAAPTNGGGTPIYQWKVNGSNVGTDQNTYSYVPVDGDAITCEMTSSLTCVSGSPATSNTVTMTVNPAGSAVTFNVDMTGVAIFNPVTDGIFISGSMNGWAEPGSSLSYKMNPVSAGSSIYTITLTIPDGEIQYKYFRVISETPSWDYGEWDGDPNRLANITGVATLNDVWATHNTTWTGAMSNSWIMIQNWTNNVPGSISDVTVPAGLTNYPSIFAPSSCHNITLESGATLLDNGNLNVTGTATVKRYITGSAATANTNWHLMGIPIQSTLSDTFWNCWLKEWLEPTGTYSNIGEGVTLNTAMKGYAVRYTGPFTTLNFNGTLNTGTLSIPLTSAGGAYDGWNLVSNPYPSAIDWNAVTIPTGMNSAIYYWEPTLQTYLSYVSGVGAGSRYAPPMQGFFVNTTAPVIFELTNAVRTHLTAPFYKEEVANLLKLSTSANNGEDYTFVRFDENATAGFDGNYDAYKLFSDATEVPQIYSTAYNDMLSINTLPSVETNNVVPVAFRAGVSGNYAINASGIESFDNSTPIWLEDKVLNTAVDFRTNTSYTFNYTAGSNDNRFLLHFKSAFGINDPSNLKINVYAYDQTIYVNLPQVGMNGNIVVYNALGQEVARKTIDGKQFNTIHMGNTNANYIVKVVTDNKVCTEKVFVR